MTKGASHAVSATSGDRSGRSMMTVCSPAHGGGGQLGGAGLVRLCAGPAIATPMLYHWDRHRRCRAEEQRQLAPQPSMRVGVLACHIAGRLPQVDRLEAGAAPEGVEALHRWLGGRVGSYLTITNLSLCLNDNIFFLRVRGLFILNPLLSFFFLFKQKKTRKRTKS